MHLTTTNLIPAAKAIKDQLVLVALPATLWSLLSGGGIWKYHTVTLLKILIFYYVGKSIIDVKNSMTSLSANEYSMIIASFPMKFSAVPTLSF